MKALVTGATGLLGSHVIDLLLERGERPRALVQPGENADRFAGTAVDVRSGDVRDAAALHAAMEARCTALLMAAPWKVR